MSQRMPRDDVHGVVVGIGDDGVGSLGEEMSITNGNSGTVHCNP
jgi:hypothetical protein